MGVLYLFLFLFLNPPLHLGGAVISDDDFDKPLIAKIYVSQSMDETLKEIQNFKPVSRPLIKMQFIKKRREFG